MSLMTAQAIESVPQQLLNSINNNGSSLLVPDIATLTVNDRINLGTTLALLVGLIQVSLIRSVGRTNCEAILL
jgi:hypothetical protein